MKLKVKNGGLGILRSLSRIETVWMSHGDTVEFLPENFKVLGSTAGCPNAAIGNLSKKIYGLQFHPEVTHTPNGMKILKNFVDECGCKPNWTINNYINSKTKEIRNKAKNKNVLLLVSGGVDSCVSFALLNKAIGKKRVYGLHIDNGLMRKNESTEVTRALRRLGFDNLHVIDASDNFFKAVKGVINPEEKRKIIGHVFLKIKNKVLADLKLNPRNWLLGQGTIYPDTIETGGTKKSALIKTHHNRIAAITKLVKAGKVIEPLNQLYKDEVRELGLKLGLPEKIVQRQPFPGPGLGIRALCAKKPLFPRNIKSTNLKLRKLVKGFGLKAYLLPIKSVGVQGDARTYRNPVALTGRANWKTLEKVSTLITNEIKEVNRVVYCIEPKEIRSVNLIPGDLNANRIKVLKEADYTTMKTLKENNLLEEIWQCPTVLIPISVNKGRESVVIRPVHSKEAMTAKFAQINMRLVRKLSKQINLIDGIDAVFYDVTHKPPGTIEWE